MLKHLFWHVLLLKQSHENWWSILKSSSVARNVATELQWSQNNVILMSRFSIAKRHILRKDGMLLQSECDVSVKWVGGWQKDVWEYVQ